MRAIQTGVTLGSGTVYVACVASVYEAYDETVVVCTKQAPSETSNLP